MDVMLARLGSFSVRRRWSVLVGWLVIAGVLFGLGGVTGGAFADDFTVPGSDSQQAVDLIGTHFAIDGNVSADIVVHVRSGTVRDPARVQAIAAMLDDVRQQPHVVAAPDPVSGGMVSTDGRTAFTTVQYTGPADDLGAAAVRRLEDAADPVRRVGGIVEFRGWVVEAASRPETGLAELVGLAAAALVLLLAFGSLVAATLPIATSIIGLGTGSALVLLVAAAVNIPSAAPIVAVMLGLGAGIDYALFLVARMRQHLAEGDGVHDAVAKASGSAGTAIVFAGGTVVVAILGLNVAEIPFVGAMGLAAALMVAVMVLAALTLLPAILGVLGHRVNAGRLVRLGKRKTAALPRQNRWLRWGEQVRRYRWFYAVGATVVLLVLAAPLLALRLGMPDDRVQPTSMTQRRAYDLIAQNFGPGFNGPLLVTVDVSASGPAVIDRLATAVAADPAVAMVAPPQRSPDGAAVLLAVIPEGAPQDASTTDLVHRMRTQVLPNALAGTTATAHVDGQTALMIDMADRVGDRLPWVIGGVVIASFLLLVLMFRSILVPLKAAVLTLLSIGAAYGVIVAVFQWGWGLALIGIHEPVPIMSVVPMFLFAVLFGLSMDYEVFLMSRIREDYLATGDPHRSVVTGLAATGRVITSAAAIMTAVFLSFVGIANPLVKMVGIGLAAAVLVDATLIRMMLAPALMSLFGATAWWLPSRRRRSPDAADHEPAPTTAPTGDRSTVREANTPTSS